MVPRLELIHEYCNQKSMSTRKTFQSLKGWSKCEVISDMNTETEILQGVNPLLKVCTDPLPEDNNWNFQGFFPMRSLSPLGRHNSLVFPITKSLFSVVGFTLDEGGWLFLLLISLLYISKSLDFLDKTNLSYNNDGIFHDLNVEWFRRHPSQCGNTWFLTIIRLALYDSSWKEIR